MAAISGIVCSDISNKFPSNKIAITEQICKSFKIDRYDKIVRDNLFLSCAHQYFTPESVNDISPIYDDTRKIYMTGDIFLFNRGELIKNIKCQPKNFIPIASDIGDVALVYNLYTIYGTTAFSMLKGCYSFVIYDGSISTIFLVTDHLAQRHLAYTIKEGNIYFSTSLHVISVWLSKEKEIDEEWLSAAFLDFSPETERLPGRCYLKNVFRVEPGTYLQINTQNLFITKIKYWDPIKTVKKLSYNNNDDYFKELFKKTFINAVKSCLRARKNYGIMLSGGLDSSSIVSVAANELEKENKVIYSYTQIPIEDFISSHSPYVIENETEEVLHNKERYPNIECKFISYNGKTCVSDLEKITEIFQQPVKPILNMPYILSLSKEAEKDQCSILFNGQGGNATISYGNVYTYVHQNVKQFHFIKAIKGASKYCSLYGARKIRVLRLYFKLIKAHIKTNINSELGYINKQLVKKYNLKKINNNIVKQRGDGLLDSVKRRNNFIYMPLTFQHFGYYDTCRSLYFGFLPLDPTLSSDVIELCLSMPIDCFFHNGKERRAVRDYLKGIVSDQILDNLKKRGRQGADYVFRFNKYFDCEYPLLLSYINYPELFNYLDKEKMQKLIEKINENKYNLDSNTIVQACVSAALGCFFKLQNKKGEIYGSQQENQIQTTNLYN